MTGVGDDHRSARLLSVASALPDAALPQDSVLEMVCAQSGLEGRSRKLAHAAFGRAGVERRGSVAVDADGAMGIYERPSGVEPTTGERVRAYKELAPELAHHASVRALERATVEPSRVTHVVTASCTGFSSPGVDQTLIDSLGLNESVSRTNIGFMGCHAAINALAVAKAFAESSPGSVVLVCCVELCTLHFRRTSSVRDVIPFTLFGDGSASAVVTSPDYPGAGGAPGLRSFSSVRIPGTSEMMTWEIGDHGFEMTLSPEVPDVLARHVPGWARAWLGRHDLTPGDIGSWAVHPGGPRVLETVRDALGLPERAIEPSRCVLSRHGNMSSPTVLFLLEGLLAGGAGGRSGSPIVSMAFGPGLVAEGVLLW